MTHNDKGLVPFQSDHGLFTLRDAMNQLFDESFWAPFERGTLARLPTAMSVFPKVDVAETNDAVIVTANIPGLPPEDISVEVADGVITISGEMRREHKEEDRAKRFYRHEREYGSFTRSFALPAKVNESSIEAETKNGVLTVTLPKSKEEVRKKIEVKVK